MKKIVKKVFDKLGYTISKKTNEDEIKILSLDEIYSLKMKQNPLIFDMSLSYISTISLFQEGNIPIQLLNR